MMAYSKKAFANAIFRTYDKTFCVLCDWLYGLETCGGADGRVYFAGGSCFIGLFIFK